MLWALVFMTTIGRSNVPEYVELYNTREECIKLVKKPTSAFENQKMFCVPVAKVSK